MTLNKRLNTQSAGNESGFHWNRRSLATLISVSAVGLSACGLIISHILSGAPINWGQRSGQSAQYGKFTLPASGTLRFHPNCLPAFTMNSTLNLLNLAAAANGLEITNTGQAKSDGGPDTAILEADDHETAVTAGSVFTNTKGCVKPIFTVTSVDNGDVSGQLEPGVTVDP